MGKSVLHNRVKRYALLLLTVLLSYISSNSLFIHHHHWGDGVITHSHFYTGNPDNPDHNHSQSQLQLIAALTKYVATVVGATFNFNPILILCGVMVAVSTNVICRNRAYCSLRAPPVMISTL